MLKNRRLVEALATFGYLGKFPKCPGTIGTFGGIPVAWLLTFLGPIGFIIGAIAFILLAIFVSQAYEDIFGVHDSGEIVIDEVAGYVVTVALLPMTGSVLLAGFVLFRIFDILKPYPISYLDKKVKGGFGVVIDDVAAGIAASVVLQIIAHKTDWLGFTI